MHKYAKIKTVWKRDPENKYKTLVPGEWATPEFLYLKDLDWTWTEKVDGTNIRVMWEGERVRFGGRTDRAEIPTFLYDKLQDMFPNERVADVFGDPDAPVCLYGEGYGVKIQKGGGAYIPDGVSFILFDVLVGNWWLRRPDVEGIAESLGIDVVPVVGEGPLIEAIELVRDGLLSKLRDREAEGLVMKPKIDLFARDGKRIVTKIKHRDFRR